jgi:hypothetical protein
MRTWWQRRAWELVRNMSSERRFRDLFRLIHSRIWRTVMRAKALAYPYLYQRRSL